MSNNARRKQRGAALIAVLWVALFLGLLSVGLVATGRSNALVARNVSEIAQARVIADAAIEIAIYQLLGGTGVVPLNGSPSLLVVAGRNIELSIHDALGFLDINGASEENLRLFLLGIGLGEAQSAALAAAIADWRDSDDIRRLNGAERDEYLSLGKRYQPRNRRFDRVDELRHVLGMTSAILERAASYLTVHGGNTIDFDVASAEVMRSVPGISNASIAERLRMRPTASRQYRGQVGHAYRITARMLPPTGVAMEREAWVRLVGDSARPFWILEWRSSS